MSGESNNEVKMTSLYKALKILDLFDGTQKSLGISEISRETGMLKSSVHNVMATFCVYGLIEKTDDNRYQLGKKTAELSNIFLKNYFSGFLHDVKKGMKLISNQINETLFLACSSVPNIMYLDSITPVNSFVTNNIQGLVVPMHCTGIGKAILARCSEEDIIKTCNLPMKKYTQNTIVDKDELYKEIQTIKQRGYSIDNMEHEFGVKCVAISFVDEKKNVYGVSVSGPSLRFSNEKCEEYYSLLRETFKEYM